MKEPFVAELQTIRNVRNRASVTNEVAYRHAVKLEHYYLTTLADLFGPEYAEQVRNAAESVDEDETP